MIGLVQVLLVGRAIRRLGERVVLPLSLCAGAVGLASMALIRDPVLAFLCQPFLALSSAAQPTLQSLLTRRVGPTEQGRLQGALSSVQGVVGMVGPVLFTQTFAWAVRPGGIEVPGAPFLLAALLVLAAVPLALRETREPEVTTTSTAPTTTAGSG